MTGREVHFKFDLNQQVLVKDILRPGVVDSLIVDSLGEQYRVTFWDNGDRKSFWLRENEIAPWQPTTT